MEYDVNQPSASTTADGMGAGMEYTTRTGNGMEYTAGTGDGTEYTAVNDSHLRDIQGSATECSIESDSTVCDVDDMCSLLNLDLESLVGNLCARFRRHKVYTGVSRVLLATNPYQNIHHMYGQEVVVKYSDIHKLKNGAPHVYKMAASALRNMIVNCRSQSILVCGESGSGKTETTKYLLGFLGSSNGETISSKDSTVSLESRIRATNPILESFGNARTCANDNSSRFSKFTKLIYSPENVILGAQIETYLLEKSRVVRQSANERNFHVFHQIMSADRGMTQKFEYLNGFLSDIGESCVSDSNDVARFAQLSSAFRNIGFSQMAMDRIFGIIQAILHLGNIDFNEDSDGNSTISPPTSEGQSALCSCSELLRISEKSLEKRLLTRNIRVGGQVIEKPLCLSEAVKNRDSIAKTLYSRLFDWIVRNINNALQPPVDTNSNKFIGILDVFGFECFDKNSFEQLCINYANEKLQELFSSSIVRSEQSAYLSEGVPWHALAVPESACLCLIEGRARGVFATLDAACTQPKGTSEIFVTNLFQLNPNASGILRRRSHPGVPQSCGFVLEHYAQNVEYDCAEFLIKNSDSVHPDTLTLFRSSSCGILQDLGTVDAKSSIHRSFRSVGSVFCRQLTHLMEIIKATEISFIRCLNPNTVKSSEIFDTDHISNQLHSGGILEAVKVMKCGYPTRLPYSTLDVQLTEAISGNPILSSLPLRLRVAALLAAVGVDEGGYELGLTKIFFRPSHTNAVQLIMSQASRPLSEQQFGRIRKMLLKRRLRQLRGTIRCVSLLTLSIRRSRRARAAKVIARVCSCYCMRVREKRKRAAVCIQGAWIMFKIRRLENEHQRFRASIIIARAWVRHMERKNRRARELATRRIQSMWRRHTARKSQKRVYRRRLRASIIIRRAWSNYVDRKYHRESECAARRIQSVWRCHLARTYRTDLLNLRRRLASETISRAFSSYLDRKRRENAAVRLQRAWRKFAELRRKRAARTVTRACSRFLERKRRERAATRLQKFWKRRRERNTELTKLRRQCASLVIAHACASYLARKKRRESAAVCVQRAWRHRKERRREMEMEVWRSTRKLQKVKRKRFKRHVFMKFLETRISRRKQPKIDKRDCNKSKDSLGESESTIIPPVSQSHKTMADKVLSEPNQITPTKFTLSKDSKLGTSHEDIKSNSQEMSQLSLEKSCSKSHSLSESIQSGQSSPNSTMNSESQSKSKLTQNNDYVSIKCKVKVTEPPNKTTVPTDQSPNASITKCKSADIVTKPRISVTPARSPVTEQSSITARMIKPAIMQPATACKPSDKLGEIQQTVTKQQESAKNSSVTLTKRNNTKTKPSEKVRRQVTTPPLNQVSSDTLTEKNSTKTKPSDKVRGQVTTPPLNQVSSDTLTEKNSTKTKPSDKVRGQVTTPPLNQVSPITHSTPLTQVSLAQNSSQKALQKRLHAVSEIRLFQSLSRKGESFAMFEATGRGQREVTVSVNENGDSLRCDSRSIDLLSVRRIIIGKSSLVFPPAVRGSLCFSVVTETISFHLKASDRPQFTRWLNGLRRLMRSLKRERPSWKRVSDVGRKAESSAKHAAGGSKHATGMSTHEAGVSKHATGISKHEVGGSKHAAKSLKHAAGMSKHVAGSSKHGAKSLKQEAGVSNHASEVSQRVSGSSKRVSGSSKRVSGSSKRVSGSSKHVVGVSKREVKSLKHANNSPKCAAGSPKHEAKSSKRTTGGHSESTIKQLKHAAGSSEPTPRTIKPLEHAVGSSLKCATGSFMHSAEPLKSATGTSKCVSVSSESAAAPLKHESDRIGSAPERLLSNCSNESPDQTQDTPSNAQPDPGLNKHIISSEKQHKSATSQIKQISSHPKNPGVQPDNLRNAESVISSPKTLTHSTSKSTGPVITKPCHREIPKEKHMILSNPSKQNVIIGSKLHFLKDKQHIGSSTPTHLKVLKTIPAP
eukprot:872617_1